MKFLFDLFPVVLFFVALQALRTSMSPPRSAIAATFAQVAWLKLRGKRKVEPMLWASLAIIVVFGGATLLLQDETFIKWKPTVLYWLFGAVLAGAALLFRRNLIRAMLSEQMQLPDAGLGAPQLELGRLLRLHGRAQPLRRLQLLRRTCGSTFKLFGGMGLMLAVRRRAGAVPRHATSRRSRERRRRRIRERLAALEPLALDLVDESAQHAGHAGAAPAAARTGAWRSCRRASPASPPSRATAWSTRRSAS